MKNDIASLDIQDFLSFLQVKRRMGKNTIVGHKSRIRIIASWFTETDAEFTSQSVEKFYMHLQQKGLSSKGLNNYFHTFRMLAKFLEDRGTPAPFLENFNTFKEEETHIDPLTIEEIQMLIHAKVKHKSKFWQQKVNRELFSDIINFLALTGCRWNECISLKTKFVDIPGKMVVFAEKTKTKRVRRVYISEPLVGILEKRIMNKGAEDLVFQNTKNGAVHGPDFITDLHERAIVAGIKKRVHPHLFRHSYAQALYEETGDPYLVKQVLGHQNIATTLMYIRLGEDLIRNAQLAHPFVQVNAESHVLIKRAEDAVKAIKFEKNSNFDRVKIVAAINEFILSLHKSVKS